MVELTHCQHFSNDSIAFLRELSEINNSVIYICWHFLIFSDMQELKPCGKGRAGYGSGFVDPEGEVL